MEKAIEVLGKLYSETKNDDLIIVMQAVLELNEERKELMSISKHKSGRISDLHDEIFKMKKRQRDE